MVAMNTDQMEKMSCTFMKTCEEMSHMTNDLMSVAMQASAVWTKGCEEIYSNFTTMMKTSYENNMAASRAMMGAKSVTDAMNVQASAMKSNSDYLMEQTNKLSEISTRMAQDVMSPITEQMNTAISMATKFGKAA